MSTQIYSVDAVEFGKAGNDKVEVKVRGRVATTGWTDVRLVPSKEHINDRYIGLDIVGIEPTDMVTDLVTPVEVSTEVERGGKAGVVVYSANDSVTQDF